MTRDSLRRAAEAAQGQGPIKAPAAVEPTPALTGEVLELARRIADPNDGSVEELIESGPDVIAALLELPRRVGHVLSRLGVQDHGGDVVAALESWADGEHERSQRASDERNRFITANTELGRRCVRQGYALRVLSEVVASARRETEARAAWLAALPPGACPSPPPAELLAAEAATRAALAGAEHFEEEARIAEAAHQQLVAENQLKKVKRRKARKVRSFVARIEARTTFGAATPCEGRA